jgi:hypothetical protein
VDADNIVCEGSAAGSINRLILQARNRRCSQLTLLSARLVAFAGNKCDGGEPMFVQDELVWPQSSHGADCKHCPAQACSGSLWSMVDSHGGSGASGALTHTARAGIL